MKKITQFLQLSLLSFLPLEAVVIKPIDEAHPIALEFSTSSHNRISIEDGHIEKIFGDAHFFRVTIDRSTGQAFINIVREITTPQTLTVITSGGYVQDVHVVAADKPSEHLKLKEPNEEMPVSQLNLHTYSIELINSILEGKTPLGYGKRALEPRDHLSLPSPLEAVPLRAFEGVFESITVYRITNHGKHPALIRAGSLKQDKHIWTFINANELQEKEQAICVVATAKEEGGNEPAK